MFTSRAEYRLTPARRQRRPAADPDWARRRRGRAASARARSPRRPRRWRPRRRLVGELRLSPTALRRHGIAVNADGVARSAAELLAYPGIDVARLAAIWPELGALAPAVAEQLEIDARYAGYLERQARDIAAFRRDEALLPARQRSITPRSAACRRRSAASSPPRARRRWAPRRGSPASPRRPWSRSCNMSSDDPRRPSLG